MITKQKKDVSALASTASMVIHSKDIFGEGKMVLIQHHEDWYRLMISKEGELILAR